MGCDSLGEGIFTMGLVKTIKCIGGFYKNYNSIRSRLSVHNLYKKYNSVLCTIDKKISFFKKVFRLRDSAG